jgi:sugar lactone lactonase YvrE
MYVVELAKAGLGAAEQGKLTGALIRVAPDGTRSELAAGKLFGPAGVAVGRDGTVYVATFSVFASKGQLVAITP